MKRLLWLAFLVSTGSAWAQPLNSAPQWVQGEIVAVDADRARVTLKHEAIRTKTVEMDPMTMPFKAANASMLKPFKTGEKVRFVLVLRDDELLVTQIEAAP